MVDCKKQKERLHDVPVVGKIAGCLMLAEVALPFVAIAVFVFDREVSDVLYGLGLDPAKLTSFFFLQNKYDFFLTKIASANLRLYDFHIFELVAWFAILVGVMRLVTTILLLDYVDARLDIRKIFSISGVKFFFGWIFIVSVGFYSSMNVNIGKSSAIFRSLMVDSPCAFLCVQAVVFCLVSIFFFEGLWLILQLAVAVRRRGSLVQPAPARHPDGA
jgi:hypothetical protein